MTLETYLFIFRHYLFYFLNLFWFSFYGKSLNCQSANGHHGGWEILFCYSSVICSWWILVMEAGQMNRLKLVKLIEWFCITSIRARKNFDLTSPLSRTADRGQGCQCYCLTLWLQCSAMGCLPCLFPFLLIRGTTFRLSRKWEVWQTTATAFGNHIILHQLDICFFMGECDLSFICLYDKPVGRVWWEISNVTFWSRKMKSKMTAKLKEREE